MVRTFTCTLLLCLGVSLYAQSDKAALAHLATHYEAYGLSATDIIDLRVSDAYPSPNGVEHVYIEQYHQGVLVQHAQAILHFREGELVSQSVNLATGLAEAELPATPQISAETATVAAARTVAAAFGRPVRTDIDKGQRSFVWPAVSSRPITAELAYVSDEGHLVLAWSVLIDRHAASGNVYAIEVDATSGDILRSTDRVLHCNFGPSHQHDLAADCAAATPKVLATDRAVGRAVATPQPRLDNSETVADGAEYLVFPFGVESPIHGARELVSNPADEEASPFGWHDTNGEPGAEFTITRGNNTYTYPDRGSGVENDDRPDEEVFDGGEALSFQAPFDSTFTADSLLPAALAQAFYTVNSVHDWLYHHGFDEKAGNFQQNNYDRGGRGGDAVQMEVQDGTSRGNANFVLSSEGNAPRMQMMLFNGPESDFQVVSPASLAGIYPVGLAEFGAQIDVEGPYQAAVALADDGTEDSNLACSEIINGDFLAGKIALITRGECSFSQKVQNAENAGAIGVMICNNEPNALVNMLGTDGFPVTIPSVFLTREDCNLLRPALAEGENLVVRFESLRSVPFDSDFDAGIVAHEYGHGVSSRLVGGPSIASCVSNDENMGEGWSDFFTLASSPFALSETPDGSEARGIGTYVTGQAITGRGIRTQPYSTDRSVNTKTYNDVIFTGQGNAPHPVGEIWAATLWDLYWYHVDKYGMDPDLINGTGGNNRAVELVVEGMKFTSCNPGLLDARDGILEANQVVFGGEDQCEIYDIFAARGMGFSAVQGSTADRTDNTQAFDTSPYCTGNIELSKTVSPGDKTITSGDEVTYNLQAFSYRDATTENVVITDVIPSGMTLVPGSIGGDHDDVTVNGNTLTFTIDEMEFEDDVLIEYSVMTDENYGTQSFYFNGAETDDDEFDWLFESLDGENFIWEVKDTVAYEGDLTYFIKNGGTTHDQVMTQEVAREVLGDRPALRFFTKYQTEPGWDAGIVELSTDGSNWTRVLDEDLLRGKFRGEVAGNATETLRGAGSFWGESDGFQEIIVDLSDYAGEEIFFRFRFLEDANTPAVGWWIDNVELVDVANYESTATLTSDSGDDATASVGDLGVVAYGGGSTTTNTTDPMLGETEVRVFPNPAAEVANVRITTQRAGSATVQLLTLDGRALQTQQLTLTPGENGARLATSQLPTGVYIVQVTGTSRVSTTKLTVQ